VSVGRAESLAPRMAASAPRPCFFVHKNPSLNFPSFHPLTISNFRLLPSGTLSWNRMRRLLSQPNWFCSFSSSQFPAQPKKNRQLQKIGFVSLSLSQRDRPPGKCGRTGSPPTVPPTSHPPRIGFVSSNASQLPFQTQRKVASPGKLASFRQISASGTGLLACPPRVSPLKSLWDLEVTGQSKPIPALFRTGEGGPRVTHRLVLAPSSKIVVASSKEKR
jgi:hypothetical protein